MMVESINTGSKASVMQILDKVVVRSEFGGQVLLTSQTAKERLQELRNLRFKINEESEEACIQFICEGGIQSLSEIIVSQD